MTKAAGNLKYILLIPTMLIVLVWLVVGGSIALSQNKGLAAQLQPLRRAYAEQFHTASSANTVNYTNMGTSIDEILAKYSGMQVSVTVTDLSNDKSFHYGVDESYVAASTTKVITSIVFLQQVETGEQSLTEFINGESAQSLLQRMIVNSDNDAWKTLNSHLGYDTLQTWGQYMGLNSYDSTANTINTDDLALVLTKLYKGELIDTTNTRQLLAYMKEANRTEYIVNAVPSSVNVYHKAGWLDDRAHDAAIIDDGKHKYVLVIFSKVDGFYDPQIGQLLFKDITDATLKAFEITS